MYYNIFFQYKLQDIMFAIIYLLEVAVVVALYINILLQILWLLFTLIAKLGL